MIKKTNILSWFQEKPKTSLNIINQLTLPKSAKIIDIGGGDSFLVDNLIELGYENITVFDISETVLNKAKKRLKNKADKVKWIVADVATFKPNEKYDLWHDRAAFHFLTQETEILSYINTVQEYINSEGFLVIGTFSEQGPDKCSGINIKQYSEKEISERFRMFKKVKCISTNHKTPLGSIQNFVFCTFRKL